MASAPLLGQLLARGDKVAITNGRLTITAASGRPVPPEWLEDHRQPLLAEVAHASNTLALAYLGYTTGNYGPHRAGGVTLQFCCLTTGQPLYAIFNAETRRKRSTRHGKAGEPLPCGQFRAGPRSNFHRFWQSTGLPVHRLSDFHDYMGKLRGLIYTARITEGEQLDKATLQPLTLILPDKVPTTSRQAPDNTPTRFPDKELPESQQQQGFQSNQTTGLEKHGNTVTRERGYTGSITSPESQTTDEWLADYSAS